MKKHAWRPSMGRNRYPIVEGDRIFVRVMEQGRTLMELWIANVRDWTSLVGEIRYAGRKLYGLTKLFIRNHSRGWSTEQLMKFYEGVMSPERRELQRILSGGSLSGSVPHGSAHRWTGESLACSGAGTVTAHMPFPWETH